MTKKVKNLVIGAGISGLTFAKYIDSDYLILEKDSEVGGYCRTIKNDNYIWDYAGHFYHFKTDEFKSLFLSLVEPDQIITQNKITKIYYEDRLIDYPFQKNIHQLSQKDMINAIYDLFTKKEKDNYDNFLDMLYGKFGKSIVEMFLKPYNEKLYATDLTNLDTDAMGRFFPHANIDDIIRNFKQSDNTSYNDSFLYLKKGTQYFIDKLYDQLDPSKIKFNTCVQEINENEKYVITSNNEKIYYENLINTTPLNSFLHSLGMNNIVKDMSYNKVLVLNIGFDGPSKKYTKEHWIYYPSKDLNFYRVGFYNNILNTENLSVYVEIGYPKDGTIDVEKELKATLEGMSRVGILDGSIKMADYSYVIMDPAYVHISTDTEKRLDKTKDALEQKSIYTTGRYGKWTYSSMEDCMIWAKEISDKINNR